MQLGVKVTSNSTLEALQISNQASYGLVYIGGILLLTSGMGWTAAAQKSEPLGFLVSDRNAISCNDANLN